MGQLGWKVEGRECQVEEMAQNDTNKDPEAEEPS